MQKNHLTIIALASIAILTACQSGTSTTATADITGTYSRVDSNQFSILYQRVQIAPLGSETSNQYQVKVFSITDFLDSQTNDTTEKASNATFDRKLGLLTTDKQLVYQYDPASGKLVVKGTTDEVTFHKQ